MIEVGILKNFDSGTYKAGVQLAGSLTTYFDDISVAKNIPSSALVVGNYVIVAIPQGNPKDACVIATWPQGLVPKFTPKSVATELWRRDNANNSSFEAQINGTPTATTVVYDNDVQENSLPDPTARPQWGKVILHNITRGNSRKITNVNLATNTITTESSVDDWADNDIITIGSQTCDYKAGYTYSRYFDVDISAEVPATAIAVLVQISNNEQSGMGAVNQNGMGTHPFTTYSTAQAVGQFATAGYQRSMSFIVIPVYSQKICIELGAFYPINASNMTAFLRLRGYWE